MIKRFLSLAFAFVSFAAVAQTSVTPINIGSSPNDGTGDPLRTAFTKANANDAALNAGKMEKTNPVVTGTISGAGTYLFLNNAMFSTVLNFTNPATGPANAFHVGGNFFISGGPSDVEVSLSGNEGGSAAVATFNAENLHANNDVTAANNVNAGNQMTAPTVNATALNVAGLGTLAEITVPGSHSSDEHFGLGSVASGGQATAVGPGASATGNQSFAGGQGSSATGATGVSVGKSATTSGGAVAVGGFSAAVFSDVAVGNSSAASGTLDTVVGGGTTASGNSDTVVGNGSSASGTNEIIVGVGSTATFENTTLIGNGISDTSANQFILGRPDQVVIVPGKSIIQTNAANFYDAATVGGATSWTANVTYTNGPQRARFELDCSSQSGSGSANQLFIHYTNNGVGRVRQVYFPPDNLLRIVPVSVPLNPGGSFQINLVTGSGGTINLINENLIGQ